MKYFFSSVLSAGVSIDPIFSKDGLEEYSFDPSCYFYPFWVRLEWVKWPIFIDVLLPIE
jgi:hypothetical protein